MGFESSNGFEIYTIFKNNIITSELFDLIDKINLSNKKIWLIIDMLSDTRVSNNYNTNDYVFMIADIDEKNIWEKVLYSME